MFSEFAIFDTNSNFEALFFRNQATHLKSETRLEAPIMAYVRSKFGIVMSIQR